MNKPKYSIVIPVNNVINYLPTTIESITSQNYTDYELIISDDNSTDGTAEYIDSLNHPNIKVLHTISRLTMAEHFDWALTHVIGEWCMFVGGDDGLQPYFFQLADKLTSIANRKSIRTIASKRAYFFWNGCQKDYGDTAVLYDATNKYKIKNTKKEMYNVLYSKTQCGYFELPQMYTISLFHVSLINEIRKKQNGKFLTYGIADANMAAHSILNEKKYLYSEIPLGWVGTSPKVLNRSDDFINKIKLHPCCGNYRLDFLPIYFLGALLAVSEFDKQQKIATFSKEIIESIVAHIYLHLNIDEFIKSKRYEYFLEFLKINGLQLERIKQKSLFIDKKNKLLTSVCKIISFSYRCILYIFKHIPITKKYLINKGCKLHISWNDQPNITMETASQIVMQTTNENMFFKDF